MLEGMPLLMRWTKLGALRVRLFFCPLSYIDVASLVDCAEEEMRPFCIAFMSIVRFCISFN